MGCYTSQKIQFSAQWGGFWWDKWGGGVTAQPINTHSLTHTNKKRLKVHWKRSAE